ncbi:MAG: hypothetical protein ABL876_03170 [Chitinophagaceae bacterium]
MKKNAAILLLFLAALVSCNQKKQVAESKTTTTTDTATATAVPDKATDSAAIRKTIVDFYNWYDKNYMLLNNYHLYASIKKKNAPPYKINWDEVERYHQFLRLNIPQLGEEFVMNQKRFFKECDSAFKLDTEGDIPYGFDYDWYTNSQEEPSYLLKQVNKSKPWGLNWSGEYVLVDVKGNYDNNGKKEDETLVTLTMKKEGEEWKIAKIGTDN